MCVVRGVGRREEWGAWRDKGMGKGERGLVGGLVWVKALEGEGG